MVKTITCAVFPLKRRTAVNSDLPSYAVLAQTTELIIRFSYTQSRMTNTGHTLLSIAENAVFSPQSG